jgi:ABC-2 type transport system permease protein
MTNHYWQQVLTVTTWEFKRFFKWKQELMSYGLIIAIIFGIGIWQEHIADDKKVITIAVSEEIKLPENDRFKITYFSKEKQQAMHDVLGTELNAVVYNKDNHVVIHVSEKDKWLNQFKSWMSEAAQLDHLNKVGISGEELEQILTPYQYQLKVKGEEDSNNDKSSAALMTMVLLMVGVFTAFAYAFASITTEKQQRVTEQLLSTIDAQTWMDGKIFGITLLCLKSLITTSLSIFIFYQIMSIIEGGSDNAINLEFVHLLSLASFVILGLLMWNSLLAGFAATIDDPNHSSRTILMLVPIIPIFLAYSLADAPQSITMQFLSYFPLTSFAAMPIRMAEASIAMWEIIVSIGILLAAIYVFRKAAARLFNMGVMMYGKEPGINEMIGALMNSKTNH